MSSGRGLLLIADIGGYTEYMRTHRMSLAHAEVNTARLLEKVIDAAPEFDLIEVEVVGDGRVIATLGPGQGFGEIALLHQVRRTATVRAAVALRLQALRSELFLAAVLGYPPSASEAGTTVDSMLDRFTPHTSRRPDMDRVPRHGD